MIKDLYFKKLHNGATLPTRGSKNAAGLDLYSVEEVTIKVGERRHIRTGIAVAIPNGFYGRVAPRSGLAINFGIDVLGGVIDEDYRGEIICLLINHGDHEKYFKSGDRIAQLIIESIINLEPRWKDDLDDTPRSNKGFGSTGV